LSGLASATGSAAARLGLTEFEVSLRRSCHGQRCRHASLWWVVCSALRRRSGAEELCYVLRARCMLGWPFLLRHGLLCGTKEGSENFLPRGFSFCFLFYNTNKKNELIFLLPLSLQETSEEHGRDNAAVRRTIFE
jgi:hypothetical protein